MNEKFKIICPSEIEEGKDFTMRIEKKVTSIPIPADGILIRAKNDYKVYIMENGKRRWITTGEIFNKMGLNQNDVQLKEPEEVASIPLGKDITSWPETKPESSIDKIILGYLPIRKYGTYMGLAQAKNLGFQVMHSHNMELSFWKEQIKNARDNGMKVIVHLYPDETRIKETIQELKNEPEIIMWCSIDDFDWGVGGNGVPKEEQIKRYNIVKKYDEAHPIAITGSSWKWDVYYTPQSFDVMLYQIYPYKDNIPDPEANLINMCDRLSDYDFMGKRIIPVYQSFGPRGVYKIPRIKYSYDVVSQRLGLKSSGCWDWEGLCNPQECGTTTFHDEVKAINSDK